jgi:hypothetical protein
MGEVGSMNNKSLLKIIVDQHRDTIIRIYEDRHREDSPYMEASLTDLQSLKVMTDIGENLYRKKSRGGRL